MDENIKEARQSFREALGNSLGYLTNLGLLAIGAFVAAGWLASFHWLLDLTTHLHWHLLIAACVIAVFNVARKRWNLSRFALVFVLYFGCGTLAIYFPVSGRSQIGRGREVAVLSCNLLSSNKDYQHFRDLVASVDVDIVVVLELNRAWQAELKELHQEYRFFTELPSEDNFGIAVFSRLPMEFETKFLSDFRIPLVEGRLKVGRGATLLAAHPLPPMGRDYSASRNEYLVDLSTIARDSRNTIVSGDLNVTPYSPHFSDLLRAGNLRDSRQGFGIQASWPSELKWLGIPIDHILVGGEIEVLARQVLPISGSDHAAVLAKLVIPTPDSNDSALD